MKLMSKFIAEKYLIDIDTDIEIDPIDTLTNILIETILKDKKLKESDFKEKVKGTKIFELSNVPHDGKLADDFYAKREEIDAKISTNISPSNKKIEIMFTNRDSVFVKINLHDTKRVFGGWKGGNIVSIEMSEEIKDKLLQK